jgi:hypothetical protein
LQWTFRHEVAPCSKRRHVAEYNTKADENVPIGELDSTNEVAENATTGEGAVGFDGFRHFQLVDCSRRKGKKKKKKKKRIQISGVSSK